MACCIGLKESKPITALEVPRNIDLVKAKQMMSVFNNHFMKLLKEHMTIKNDVLATTKDNKKGCVTRVGFKKILNQAYTDLDEQCTPAITGRRKLLRSLSRQRVVTVLEQRASADIDSINCLIDQCITKEDFTTAELLKRRRKVLEKQTYRSETFVEKHADLGINQCHNEVSCWFKSVAESRAFSVFVISAIFLAAILVGIQIHVLSEAVSTVCTILDEFVVGIFCAEIAIKVLAEGKKPWRYFLDPWNVFDFLVVVAGFIPFAGGGAVMAIRLVRLLRVLKLVRAFPELQILVIGLIKSLSSIVYIGGLLFLLFYLYAVICVSVFGANDPWHFGDLLKAMVTLFRMCTLEDWTDVMYIAIEGCDKYGYSGMPDQCVEPHAFGDVVALFFILYIFLSSFMILNLFVGVITGSITDAKSELIEEKELSDRDAMSEELNQTQNTGKKIELEFKQILCSISDIHRNIESCQQLECERRENETILLTDEHLQEMEQPPFKVIEDTNVVVAGGEITE